MVESFKQRMSDLGIPDGERCLLGLSGGADSMALANLMVRSDWPFLAVHINYQLRGAESDEDETFVREWCNLHGVELIAEKAVVQGDKNIQIQARLIRYDRFEKLAKEHRIKYLLTAHHRDDQIETIYMNILRGSGFKGLRGIPEVRDNIYRPLLPFRKKELINFLEQNGFHWREDSSNQKTEYTRNRVRHEALPHLRSLIPDLDDRLLELSRCATELEINMERFLPILYDRAVRQDDDLFFIETRAFEEWNQMADMLLLELLRSMGFIWSDPCPIADLTTGKEWKDGDQTLYADRGDLILEKSPVSNVSFELDKETTGVIEPLQMGFEVWPRSEWDGVIDSGTQVAFDLDLLQFPLTLRRWRAGDRFQPLGMKGEKKLSDHFVDLKMPRPVKYRQWVLCSGDQPIWVVGGRMDGRYRLVDTTENIYLVSLFNRGNEPLES
jgi:tRNA(Ile)-lysidine synthase